LGGPGWASLRAQLTARTHPRQAISGSAGYCRRREL